MVTFRNNNNNNRRGGFKRNTRNFKSNGDTNLNSIPIFQIMIISRGNLLEEIIIMHQN